MTFRSSSTNVPKNSSGSAPTTNGPRAGIARLSAWLAAKDQQGDLVVADPDVAASQFLTMCHGAVMMPVLIGGEAPPPPARIDYLVASAADVFLSAYGPKTPAQG